MRFWLFPHFRSSLAAMLKTAVTAPALRIIAALCAVATLAHTRARAEEDDAYIAAARALAVEGVKLAQNDQCAEATDKLERAEKLRHSPIVAAHLGECYIELGRLVEGVERLRGVLRDPLPPEPSAALTAAYEKSKQLLDATRPKLAALTISAAGEPGSEVIVTIDGRPLPAALLGVPHPVDPGEHTLRASAPGHLSATRHVELGPGEEQSLSLTLSVDPAAIHAAAPAPAVSGEAAAPIGASAPTLQPSAASTDQPSGPNRLPSYIAWGAGAVALGAGIGFGAAALGNRTDLRHICPNKTCDSSMRDLLDAAQLNATISTIGYAAAIAAVATGTVLWFVLDSQPDQPGSARVRTQLGLSSAQFAVDF
jgi:hypothetical protein